ncbi:diacylglycerol kinase family protein [Pediococcus argentinicus]|nr:diacylglycerol kinase family protein [Pediococcus argentinicus]GEP18655.1 undecaprenol kinase [Pediococcus argentinicus]
MLMDSKDKRQISKNHSYIQSFQHALRGLVEVFKTERNFRFHLLIGIFVMILGIIFKLSVVEWAIIIGCIGAVLIAEIFNTVAETLVNLACEGKYHPLAKRAKDLAAGGVLTSGIIAAIIGLIVFGSKII